MEVSTEGEPHFSPNEEGIFSTIHFPATSTETELLPSLAPRRTPRNSKKSRRCQSFNKKVDRKHSGHTVTAKLQFAGFSS